MYELRNAADSAELIIYDEIGDSWFGGVSAKMVQDDLATVGSDKPLTIRLNSPGGDVFDGVAIHSQLARREGHNKVIVEGLAASIASVIAMAGDEIVMSPGSMMMVHEPWTFAMGDASELRDTANLLDSVRDNLLGIYTSRTGQDDETIRDMVAAETWMGVDEAIEFGFADSVEGTGKIAARVQPGRYMHTPPELLTEILDDPEEAAKAFKRQSASNRLALERRR